MGMLKQQGRSEITSLQRGKEVDLRGDNGSVKRGVVLTVFDYGEDPELNQVEVAVPCKYPSGEITCRVEYYKQNNSRLEGRVLIGEASQSFVYDFRTTDNKNLIGGFISRLENRGEL